MPTFFCKLHPPRPQFAIDMTPDEAALMQQHAAYWQDARSAGRVKAFGVVADPAGPYGIAVAEFDDEASARAFTVGDPVIAASRGFRYDLFLMPLGA